MCYQTQMLLIFVMYFSDIKNLATIGTIKIINDTFSKYSSWNTERNLCAHFYCVGSSENRWSFSAFNSHCTMLFSYRPYQFLLFFPYLPNFYLKSAVFSAYSCAHAYNQRFFRDLLNFKIGFFFTWKLFVFLIK